MPGTGYWARHCNTCGTLFEIGYDWEGGFCSESCYLHTLDQKDKIEYIAEKERKKAEERIEEESQKERVMAFLLNHKPIYKPEDSTVFYWTYKEEVDEFSATFLGRWQKGKKFAMGEPTYKRVNGMPFRANNLKELEKVMHEGVEYYKITDHNDNIVSWEDFFYCAVTSEINSVAQDEIDSRWDKTSFISSHHSYYFAGGLNP